MLSVFTLIKKKRGKGNKKLKETLATELACSTMPGT